MLLSLFWIIAVLVVAGLILYFVNGAPALDGTIKWLIRAVVIVVCVVLVLYFLFGIVSTFPAHPLGRF